MNINILKTNKFDDHGLKKEVVLVDSELTRVESILFTSINVNKLDMNYKCDKIQV